MKVCLLVKDTNDPYDRYGSPIEIVGIAGNRIAAQRIIAERWALDNPPSRANVNGQPTTLTWQQPEWCDGAPEDGGTCGMTIVGATHCWAFGATGYYVYEVEVAE